jgi:UDP-sugar pyrophosphorylase
MKNYLERARSLLAASMKGENPFENFKPEVPTGYFLKPGEAEFEEFEKEGVKELRNTVFVLIAGGLGERLGYSGIKVGLPVTTLEEDYCYLKYYA